jgi:hypothetical protein
MARQQIERLDFTDRSRTTHLRMDHEAEACSGNGFYFESSAGSFRLADLRFAWIGVMAGIAGLAALLLLGWSEIGAGPVGATERRADPPSKPAAAAQVETQADRMEEIRRRGLELLRADFPEDAPSPPLARGDRLELQDANIKPAVRIATAGEDERSAAPSEPLPAQPAASKPAEAKQKHAVEERPSHRRHARRTSRQHRDRVRMANAKYVQVPAEPQVALSGGLQQPNRAPPEDNNVFGWMMPSSWKDGWDNMWAKGNRE